VLREGAFDWENAEDLTALPEGEVWALLAAFAEEEWAGELQAGLLRGRMDVIHAELVCRGGAALSPEKLASVLPGRPAEGGRP
jgi:anti-sigma-K factor RsiG